MINLYNYYTKPVELYRYTERVNFMPEVAYFLARDIGVEQFNKTYPNGERCIAKNADTAYKYSKYILGNGLFPLGEDAIGKSADYSYYYAVNVLHGPFLKGEDMIATDACYSYWYARDVLHDRFIKGESVIMDGGFWSKYTGFLSKLGIIFKL
jgi:hypothetical protein